MDLYSYYLLQRQHMRQQYKQNKPLYEKHVVKQLLLQKQEMDKQLSKMKNEKQTFFGNMNSTPAQS
jgi:hypothetical protein